MAKLWSECCCGGRREAASLDRRSFSVSECCRESKAEIELLETTPVFGELSESGLRAREFSESKFNLFSIDAVGVADCVVCAAALGWSDIASNNTRVIEPCLRGAGECIRGAP